MKLPSAPLQMAVSCDDSLLAIDVVINGVPFIQVYSVPSFYTANVVKVQDIRLSMDENVRSGQLCWNPVIGNMLAICCQNGSLFAYTFKDNQNLELYMIDKSEKAKCCCWSPKGKQLVVGFANGKLVQYKPDLKPARTIPCPAGILERNFDTIAIQWLSTYQFCVAFLPLTSEPCPKIFIVNCPKTGNSTYINYDEVIYNGGSRFGHIYMHHILPWNMILLSSSSSNEVGILATTDTGEAPTWCQWTTLDDARAELPLNDKKDDTFPLGFAFETGCMHEEIVGETPIQVGAMIHLVTTDGDLLSFNILNMTAGNVSIRSPPRPPADVSGAAEFKAIDFIKTPVQQVKPAVPASVSIAPSLPAAEITFTVPNGATSTPAVPTKGKSFFSPNPAESKSPMNLFGTTSAAPKIQPSFGQAITFGQTNPASSGGLTFGSQTPFGNIGTTAAPP
jgi:nuclear pore complex protein Nup214